MNEPFFLQTTLYQAWLHMAEDSVCHSEKNCIFVLCFTSFFLFVNKWRASVGSCCFIGIANRR